MNNNLTIIIIAGNESEMITDCLKSADFAHHIVLVAANSSDDTVTIVRELRPDVKIISTTDEYGKNFAKWRNLGLKASDTDWIFYLDADERISPQLKKELLSISEIHSANPSAYAVPRANYFLGKRVRHGGTYPDYVIRFFHRPSLSSWSGFLHEQPQFKGTLAYLKSDLNHYTHRTLTQMLAKTIIWTDAEAQALYDSRHPPVVWWRFIRMFITKLWQRLITEQMYKDGTVGWISAIFEAFDTFIIYARLWEIQQKNAK